MIGNRYIKTPLITRPLATDTIKDAFGFNNAWKQYVEKILNGNNRKDKP